MKIDNNTSVNQLEDHLEIIEKYWLRWLQLQHNLINSFSTHFHNFNIIWSYPVWLYGIFFSLCSLQIWNLQLKADNNNLILKIEGDLIIKLVVSLPCMFSILTYWWISPTGPKPIVLYTGITSHINTDWEFLLNISDKSDTKIGPYIIFKENLEQVRQIHCLRTPWTQPQFLS